VLIPLIYVVLVTVPLTVIDLRQHRLPNRLVVPGYAALVAGMLWEWVASGSLPWMALVAAAGYFLFLLLLSLTGGMGMGDVKLAGVLGGAAGLVSTQAALAAPLVAFVLGGLVSLVAWAVTRSSRTRVPFGPMMLAGFWIAVLIGL
jgi:leader peptidase (prepilin peptidase)/N-methyltransferase